MNFTLIDKLYFKAPGENFGSRLEVIFLERAAPWEENAERLIEKCWTQGALLAFTLFCRDMSSTLRPSGLMMMKEVKLEIPICHSLIKEEAIK